MTRFVAFFAMLALSIGCTQGFECVDRRSEPMCQNYLDGARFIDSGPIDAGPVDAPTSDAHMGCGGPCTGTRSHCDVASDTCVECLAAADCTSASASMCNASHACVACTTNADCSHLTATSVCSVGTCVACTVTDETSCGANSCDPTTHTCTTTPRASVTTCRACVADSECMSAMDRCVPMQFMGANHGSYCLRQSSAGCMQPYTGPTPARPSTSGAAAAVYCGVNEAATTCEAVQSLIANTSCTMPSDCGAAGLNDGRCETVNFVPNHCTYSCTIAAQCPGSVSCGAGYCGS